MGNIQPFHEDLFSDDFKSVHRRLVEKWAQAWVFGETGEYFIVDWYHQVLDLNAVFSRRFRRKSRLLQ